MTYTVLFPLQSLHFKLLNLFILRARSCTSILALIYTETEKLSLTLFRALCDPLPIVFPVESKYSYISAY